MNFEKEYYENEEFWSDSEWSWELGKEKFLTTYNFIKDDVTSVVDLACGNGVFTNYLIDRKKDLRIVGYDRSETALNYVKSEKVLGDITNTPFKDNEFDCVIVNSVIEHLPLDVYERALVEIARISKKYIIISVPYKENLEKAHTQCPQCKTKFNHDLHFQSFDEQKLKNLFSGFKFSLDSTVLSDKNTKYYGHDLYRKIFYKEQFKIFNSPICPLCGFQNKNFIIRKNNSALIKPSSILQSIKKLPKLFWPKYIYFYESTSLYIKE